MLFFEYGESKKLYIPEYIWHIGNMKALSGLRAKG